MKEALAASLGEEVVRLAPIAGGDLNDAFCATLAGGARVFVKTAHDAAPGAYAAEAAGLRWLGEPRALAVPEILAVDDRFLALEWVQGDGTPLDEAALGHGLALVHRAGAGGPGALPPGAAANVLVLGPLTLPNEPAPTWPAFYAANRLLPLARLAMDRGALDRAGVAAIGAVAARIDALAGPAEPVSRLHGDLWSGNVHTGPSGRPWLIDPAAHGGHREVDLAMLSLFGGRLASASPFGDAYDEVWPRAEGHAERVALWQLFPLLVHAVLFGGAYGASAVRAAQRYA
ncbi:MAG: fructosamine kinase family protein [Conexibacter sp.]|nr:fructosamine kinase family protein [Conexibacter sp.]